MAYASSSEAAREGGGFVSGFHRWLRDQRWEHWLETDTPVASPELNPWPRRLSEYERNGFWNTTDWGPKPGKPGCQATDDRAAA